MSRLGIYRRGEYWFYEESSQPFETPEEAIRGKLNEMRRKEERYVKRFKSERLGLSFRSNWEIEVAEMLTDLGIKWEYEPRRFYFKRERESYLPDFYLPEYEVYLEVKGWMDKRSERRCKLFRKYHKTEFGFEVLMLEEMEAMRADSAVLLGIIKVARLQFERDRRKYGR